MSQFAGSCGLCHWSYFVESAILRFLESQLPLLLNPVDNAPNDVPAELLRHLAFNDPRGVLDGVDPIHLVLRLESQMLTGFSKELPIVRFLKPRDKRSIVELLEEFLPSQFAHVCVKAHIKPPSP